MRPSFAPRGGFVLIKSPNARQQARQRYAYLVGGLAALALVSGAIGALSGPRTEAVGGPQTGPLSYLSQ